MKITLKTLQQKSFVIDIDENETVLSLKERVQAEQGDSFPVEGLKLIYSGKILSDSSKISEYSIKENNFVVVMVSKGKPAPAKPQAAPPTTSTATPSTATPTPNTASSRNTQPTVTDTREETTSANQPLSVEPMEETSTDSSQPASEQSQPVDASSVLATGSEYDNAINFVTSMGYTREQAERAMQASFNNPHRAMEYLLEGNCDQVIEGMQQQQQPQQQVERGQGEQLLQGEEQEVVGAPQGDQQSEGGSFAQEFEQLTQIPQFQSLRQHLMQNPSFLPIFLAQINQHNPALFQAINEHRTEFIDFLNNPGSGSPNTSSGPLSGPLSGPPPGPTPGTIQVTQEEKEAIDRLKALGFPEGLVIQAYFACEKNENATANFLLSERDDQDPSNLH